MSLEHHPDTSMGSVGAFPNRERFAIEALSYAEEKDITDAVSLLASKHPDPAGGVRP